MSNYFVLKVTEKSSVKLGVFLRRHGFSKQAIVDAKHNGGYLLVNKRRRYSNYQLKEGDQVIFVPGKEKDNPYLIPSKRKLEIVFENENYLVINKPANLLTIPSRYAVQDSVVNRLLGYFQTTNQPCRPHIVTRLDYDTSGLVLVGKNSICHARFSQLDKQSFIKKYHAIVHGGFDELQGTIDEPIDRLGTSIKRAVALTGKKAVTKYHVLGQTANAALVELQLLTGRTHQIRVHMQYLGHPLFGDQLYGVPDAFSRQALNCYRLEFPDPFTSEIKHFEIADPADMQELWLNEKAADK